jgi:hypothetical protein
LNFLVIRANLNALACGKEAFYADFMRFLAIFPSRKGIKRGFWSWEVSKWRISARSFAGLRIAMQTVRRSNEGRSSETSATKTGVGHAI